MISSIFYILLITQRPAESVEEPAPAKIEVTKDWDLDIRWLQIPINLAVGAFATGYLHEETHRYFAKKNDWEVTKTDHTPFIGHTDWETDANDDTTKNEFVSFQIYPMIATRLASESLALSLKTRYVPPYAESLVATTALVMRADGYWQLIKGQTSLDGTDNDWRMGSRAMGIDRKWGLAILGGDLALDFLVRGELVNLFKVATGQKSYWDERRDGKKWTVKTEFSNGYLFAGIDLRF